MPPTTPTSPIQYHYVDFILQHYLVICNLLCRSEIRTSINSKSIPWTSGSLSWSYLQWYMTLRFSNKTQTFILLVYI